jgi:hypothetical protein
MATKLSDSTVISQAQEAMDFMANVLEASTEYSSIGKDYEGKTLRWNEGPRRLYGYDPVEVAGKANSSIPHYAAARNRRKAPSMEQKESLCAK